MTAGPTPGVKLEVNGEYHYAADCSWYFVAPCGCTRGAQAADTIGDGAVTTPADAHREMTPNAELRKQETAQGYGMVLGLRREVVDRMVGCPHTPRWGVEQTRVPRGYVWGEVATWRSTQSARKHLVQARWITPDYHAAWRRDPDAALCGREDRVWRGSSGDLPECRKCARKAVHTDDLPRPIVELQTVGGVL